MHRNLKSLTGFILMILVISFSFSGCKTMKRLWPFGKSKGIEAGQTDIYDTPPEGPLFPPIGAGVPLGMDTQGVDLGDDNTVIGYEGVRPPEPGGPNTQLGVTDSLPTVHFDYDSDQLSQQEQATLDQAATWILSHPNLIIQIEGHCDERGTSEYNINLGQRRADRVREFLIGRGVNPTLLTSVSYGEERPIDPGQTEEAYYQNRRAQFVVYE